MSITRVEDIGHVRFAAPDLAEMRRFLEEFGLSCFERDGRLYGRGSDGAPFAHVTERGEAAFLGLGLRLADRESLERLADSEGARVEPFDAPGGGWVVRLRDPDGNAVEAVAGQAWDEAGAHVPVSCPLLSGPSTITVWTKEGTTNACEEAQARGDYREAT